MNEELGMGQESTKHAQLVEQLERAGWRVI